MLTRATALSVFSFGGNLGFACGPITVTLVANALGISGVGLFILVGGGVALLLAHYFPAMRRQSAQHWQQKRQRESGSPVPVKDDWRHFAILACVLFGRSIIFYGLNTFLVLYWMHILKQSNTSGSLALSVLFIVGATGDDHRRSLGRPHRRRQNDSVRLYHHALLVAGL
ncbi:MFS transporter [Limosilactobacillus fermentum]|nr:MFS transporter [Limosilactobacillus fermentum]